MKALEILGSVLVMSAAGVLALNAQPADVGSPKSIVTGSTPSSVPGQMNTMASPSGEIRLVTLDPGHFHAALLHKEMWPGVSQTVHIYAPLGQELVAHLDRIRQFNCRPRNPTHWNLEVHASPNSLDRLLADRPGNVVILSGDNRGKIDRIATLVQNGFNILADKPWILEFAEIPKLKAVLESAEQRGIAAYDAMTQRFEITCLLQRELVNDAGVFGEPMSGSPSAPAVWMESVHYLLKEVAGVTNRRPAWFFDVERQGEGLTDVGTHVVDLVQWILFPDQAIDCDRDIRVLKGEHWPTLLTAQEFERVTGEPAPWPTQGPPFTYYANNAVLYTLRGVHVSIRTIWNFQAAPGVKDSETAIFQGRHSRVEVRQGQEEKFRPEVYVVPNTPADREPVARALREHIARLGDRFPGLTVEEQAARFRVAIPDRLRVGHEEHFALLTGRFLEYVRSPERIPSWERPNMIAKYYVTTKGVELARRSPRPDAPAAKGN